jgi:ribosomal protein L37AE/L43A
MADGSATWVVAINACPHCGRVMHDRAEEDYRLAPCGMGCAFSEEFGRVTTGYWFPEDCQGCGAFLTGVEYQPEPVRFEGLPGRVVVPMFDRWVAWYGLAGGGWGGLGPAPELA